MSGFWDYIHTLKARFYVVIPAALAGAVIGVVIAQVQQKQYRATTRLLVRSQRPRLISTDAEGSVRTSDQSELQTQALLVKSQAVANRTVLRLKLKNDGPFAGEEDVVDQLLDSVGVKPIRDTRFLEVSCETTDPEWAARISVTMAEAYIAENLERRRNRLAEVTGVYSLRYPELDQKLQKAEAELLKFQEDFLVVSSEKPEATLRQRELKLIEQLSQAQRDRIDSQARLMQLKTGDGKRIADASLARAISAQDPWARQLLEERLRQASRIVELRQSFSEGHRDLESAKQRLLEIEKELGEAIQGFCDHANRAYDSALWKEQEIQRILDQHRSKIAGLQQVIARYEALRQRRDSLHRLLDPLAKSQAELDLAGSLDVASSSIVDRAQAPKLPSRPIRTNYLVIGFVLGLLIGVRLAFALEASDATVRTSEDIRNMVGLATAGAVATVDRHIASDARARATALAGIPSSRAAEQFRSLRTGVLASAPWKGKGRGGIILVTSGNLGEGKSFVACNAAAAFAQLGKPVLLVDADLRRSTAHETYDIPRSPGLADILQGKAEFKDVVRKTSLPNLFVMPAGSETARPAELLASGEMMAAIQKLSTEYDTVWIDSPPVIPVADARDIAPVADLVLLVVRSGSTRQKNLIQACELLHLHEGQVLSAVINDTSSSVARYHGYYRYGLASQPDSESCDDSRQDSRDLSRRT